MVQSAIEEMQILMKKCKIKNFWENGNKPVNRTNKIYLSVINYQMTENLIFFSLVHDVSV